MNTTVKALLALLLGLLIGLAAATVVERWIIQNTGTIAITAYLTPRVDSDIHVNGSTIDWGTLTPGATYYVTLNVTNISPTTIRVYLTHTNLPSYLTATWTANDTLLTPATSAVGDVDLTVHPDAPPGATFSFTSLLTAEDTP